MLFAEVSILDWPLIRVCERMSGKQSKIIVYFADMAHMASKYFAPKDRDFIPKI